MPMYPYDNITTISSTLYHHVVLASCASLSPSPSPSPSPTLFSSLPSLTYLSLTADSLFLPLFLPVALHSLGPSSSSGTAHLCDTIREYSTTGSTILIMIICVCVVERYDVCMVFNEKDRQSKAREKKKRHGQVAYSNQTTAAMLKPTYIYTIVLLLWSV